jgi:hypothetical protein
LKRQYLTSPYAFLILALGTLAAIDLFVLKNPSAFLLIDPNPVLLVGLILSVLYGLRVAIVATAACSATYMALVHLTTNYNQVETVFDLEHLARPLIMGTVSIIFGELKQRSMDKIADLRRVLSDQQKLENYLKSKETLHEQEISELKKRLVSKLDTVRSFYEIAQSFQSMDEEALLKNFIYAVAKQFKMNDVFIYRIDHDSLKADLAAQSEHSSFPESLPLDHMDPLALRAIREQKLVTIQESGLLAKAESLLLSVPLVVNGKTEYVVGVHDVPFLEFIPSNFKVLDIYAKWVTSALEYGRTYHHSMSNNIWNEQLEIYRYRYFQDRISEEFSRSQAFLLPLTLLQIRLVDMGTPSLQKATTIRKILCGIIHGHIRKLDYVTEGRNPDEFFVVFPILDSDSANITARAIETELSNLRLQGESGTVALDCKVMEFKPEMGSVQEFLGGQL